MVKETETETDTKMNRRHGGQNLRHNAKIIIFPNRSRPKNQDRQQESKNELPIIPIVIAAIVVYFVVRR